MELQEIRNSLERKKGEKIRIEQDVDILTTEIKNLNRSLRRHEKAREVIREVGLKTQQQLSFHISDIASRALSSVFEDPYALEVEFVQRRNKTECDIFFVRDGNRVDPQEAAGVGANDIAAFALRVASWSMMKPRTRNTLFFDEPFKHLSEDLQEKASMMVKEVSKRLNLQIIIITQEQSTAIYADKTFTVKRRQRGDWKISKVTES